MSLGGLGVREGVLTFFMVKTGVLASDAVFLGLLIYLTRIVLALTGGGIQFLSLGSGKQKSRSGKDYEQG